MASLSSHVDSAYGGPNPRAKHTKSPLLVVRYVGAGSEVEGPIVNNDSVLRNLVVPSETKNSLSAFASKGCPLAGRYVVLAITPNVVIAGATLLDEDAEDIVENEDNMEDDTAEDVMLDDALEVFDDVLLDELDCLTDEEATALDELDDLADEDGRPLDELWLLLAEPVLEALALAEEELVVAELNVVNGLVADDCSRLFEEKDDAENTEEDLGALDAADDE